MKARANASEINKKPRDLRYSWVICNHSGEISTGLTFQTIRLRKAEMIKWFAFVDLYSKKVIYLIPEMFDEMIEDWRDNYFDPDWAIPEKYIQEKGAYDERYIR